MILSLSLCFVGKIWWDNGAGRVVRGLAHMWLVLPFTTSVLPAPPGSWLSSPHLPCPEWQLDHVVGGKGTLTLAWVWARAPKGWGWACSHSWRGLAAAVPPWTGRSMAGSKRLIRTWSRCQVHPLVEVTVPWRTYRSPARAGHTRHSATRESWNWGRGQPLSRTCILQSTPVPEGACH